MKEKMKRYLLFIILGTVALWAAASDRLYIENFQISAGETKQVSIILENETQYTAFQTDIYLPAGLTVVQEDDEYDFELTSRKSRDHIIMGQDRPDGAIRVVSYSLQVNPYSGTSGELVTFNITASTDYNRSATIEMKHTRITDLNEQEYSLADESCLAKLPIQEDLIGEIIIEEGGRKLFDEGWSTTGEMHEYLYISYSGTENVDFTILVNNQDLFQEYSDRVSWDNQNQRYIVQLEDFITYLDSYGYTAGAELNFVVTIHAQGYNDLEEYYYNYFHATILSEWEPGGEYGGPRISEYDYYSCLSYFIKVEYEYSVHDCNLRQAFKEDYNTVIYVAERLDHDYYLTVTAGHRSPGMSDFVYSEETFLIPARWSDISISRSKDYYNNAYSYWIIKDLDFYEAYDNKEITNDSYVIITNDNWFTYNRIKISVDNQAIFEGSIRNSSSYSYAVSFNLLPFDDAFGGDHFVKVDFTDGYNSLSIDTIIGIHPISTRLSPDSLFLDIEPYVNHLIIRTENEEIDLPSNGHYYALERLDHDYSIMLKAGITTSFVYSPSDDEYHQLSFWSKETPIVVPAKNSIGKTGDLSGDGVIDIDDVTSLINYVLNGDSEGIILNNADVSGDGAIDIDDVTSLIDYVLNGSFPTDDSIVSYTVNGVEFKLVPVEGGTFLMGATPEQGDEAWDRERPVHQVTLSDYIIGQTEVTQELWLAVMGNNPSHFTGDLQRPVEQVSWMDCQVFIENLNQLTGESFRLPTEAEWEFAARGGNKSQCYRYAGSNDMDVVSWYIDNSNNTTHPVATKAPNELGLYDMTGNVWEWCNDWFMRYTADPQVNPMGPETGNNRVLRGGCWDGGGNYNRISFRDNFTPTGSNSSGGLRLAL